jgi:hypothetical protein
MKPDCYVCGEPRAWICVVDKIVCSECFGLFTKEKNKESVSVLEYIKENKI